MLFDDPSRILWIIRFASWFNLEIAPEIEETITSDLVDWLVKYVSAEKAMIEIDKMMGGKNPYWSMQSLLKHHILHKYMSFPKTTVPAIDDEKVETCLNQGLLLV